MCGIVAYIGKQDAFPVLLEGLYRLEYRGYDSAGITVLDQKVTRSFKKKGKVSELESFIEGKNTAGSVGVGHTRWATHGVPSDLNAHPHFSKDGSISIVHNGIIENYQTLKSILEELGYSFSSETDTEVLAHLIQEYRDTLNLSLEEAVRKTLKQVIGAYALVVIDSSNPGIMIGAKKSSPLVLGLGNGDYFLASDSSPIAGHTNRVVYLEDDQMVIITQGCEYKISTLDSGEVKPEIHLIETKIEELQKEGFPHFMLKEIFQQPKTVTESMRGRLDVREPWVSVGGLRREIERFSSAGRIIFAACGTSWHTALIAEYLFEDLARIPCEVEYASEFRYRNPILDKNDVVVVISQSGETADTLAALTIAKEKGALTYGIVNVVGSSIARKTDSGSYTHAGPEIGVASTKAFTSQLTVLSLMAIQLGHSRRILTKDQYARLIRELEAIPRKLHRILEQNEKIKYVASEIKNASNALYLGRGYSFPVALEGALKLKEISYIHAEGYPAAEMKHGPIALIDLYMPVIVIATNLSVYDKIVNNIEEVKARKGIIIAIVNEGEEKIKSLADFCIEIPQTIEEFSPLLSVIPLQLLAYHIAVMRGCDVDQPRNLAKSVTVE